MDVIFWIFVAIAAIVFLTSPFIINSMYETEDAPKIVRTSTIFASFLSSGLLIVSALSVFGMNQFCGQITNGNSSFFGWYASPASAGNAIEKNTESLPANIDILGCISPLWNNHDNVLVFGVLTGVAALLITIRQFRKFRGQTNFAVGLYLTLSMLILSVIYMVTAFAIIQWILKTLFSDRKTVD